MSDSIRSPGRARHFAAAAISLTLASAISALPAGCAKRPEEAFVPGRTTASELMAALGEPDLRTNPTVRPQATHAYYRASDCSYQYERNILVSFACPPAPEETTLQYWRHRWKGKPQRFEEMRSMRDPHGHRVFQLVSPKDGKAVIYEEETDSVSKVVTYVAR